MRPPWWRPFARRRWDRAERERRAALPCTTTQTLGDLIYSQVVESWVRAAQEESPVFHTFRIPDHRAVDARAAFEAGWRARCPESGQLHSAEAFDDAFAGWWRS